MFRYATLHFVCLLLFYLFGVKTATAQTIRYVSTTGTNANPATATSWATSTTDLQGAINASTANDQVWVRAGIYKPGGPTNTDRSLSFAIKAGVAVYGGFPTGGTPTLSQRNPQTNLTTLSGEIGNPNSTTDNSYHVVMQDDTQGETRLDGFVVTGGQANGGGENSKGAGLYAIMRTFSATAHLTKIVNCTFTANVAADQAGGIYATDMPGLLLTNCSFRQNSATSGGGIYVYNGSPLITNNVFWGNSATNGGGLYFEYNASTGGFGGPLLVNCTFQGNAATNRGAALFNYDGEIRMYNSIVYGNGTNALGVRDVGNTVLSGYSVFECGTSGYFGGNFSPLPNRTLSTSPFVDEAAGNLNLIPCSPLINQGNAGVYMDYLSSNGATTDAAGNTRTVGPRLDLGAFEYQATTGQPIELTGQPASSSVVCAGSPVAVSVGVAGGVSRYQWYKNGTLLSGQTSATLAFPRATTADAGSYSVVVTGDCTSFTETDQTSCTTVLTTTGSSLTSTTFSLTVNAGPAVVITTIPASVDGSLTITQGSPITLTASTATPVGPTPYLWSTGAASAGFVESPDVTTVYSVSATVTAGCPGFGSLTVVTALPVCGSVIYVTQTGAGLRDGSSWSNALGDNQLQLAINTAASCATQISGLTQAQVWVAAGTYKPTSTTTNRLASFHMQNRVGIYGGFAGTETSLSSRTLTFPSSSILSGYLGESYRNSDNDMVHLRSLHVIYNVRPVDQTAVLDGFEISDGRASGFGTGSSMSYGGGMLNAPNASPTVRNCFFFNNKAMYGGGMANLGNNSPKLINCVFVNNMASSFSPSGNPTSLGNGGAIFNDLRVFITLDNCTLYNNDAGETGGAIHNNNQNPDNPTGPIVPGRAQLTNCIVFSNRNNPAVDDSFSGHISTVNHSFLDFQGDYTGSNNIAYTGTNNIVSTTSPFVNANSVALRTCSPAINAGLDSATGLAGITTDIAGKPRFVGGRLDMGALEFQGATTLAIGISANPSRTITEGQTATLTASGGNTYVWASGENTRSVTVSAEGTYSVTGVTGSCSGTASAFVSVTAAPPSITAQPASASTVCAGASVQVTVGVSGRVSGYQWLKNGGLVPGQTTATLSLGNVQAGTSDRTDGATSAGGVYSLSITGPGGSTVSNGFTLTVNPTPTATITFPNSITVAGSPVPVVRVPSLSPPVVFQGSGGVLYERQIVLDRINGYEIRQVDSNTTGLFIINRTGLFTLTVTGADGCKRTVQWVVERL